MLLKEIETRPPEGVMKIAFNKMNAAGQEVPEIMHLFRFKQWNTDHLVRFTEAVMRGPSPLSPGIRELIGTFVSSRSQCSFCSCAHAPVAARLLGQELVDEVIRDFEKSRLDAAHKQLFRYVDKLVHTPALVGAEDIAKLKAHGWDEEAIYDALTVASLFKFYNTWNNGAGVQQMEAADFAASGNRILTLGYCMDFGLKSVARVLWRGRREVTLRDVAALIGVACKMLIQLCFGRHPKDRLVPASPNAAAFDALSPRDVELRTPALPGNR